MSKPVSKQRMTPVGQHILKGNELDMQQLGMAIGMGMASAEANRMGGGRPVGTFKEATFSPTYVNIYGRNSIFDPCAGGDVFGLQTQVSGFMQWLGFRPNRFWRRRVSFIPWYGPQGISGTGAISVGYGAPCSNPNGWEYGVAGYDLTHTSWYHRTGDGLDPHSIAQERCETSPRYRVNGVQINDDVEWQMNGIMNVLQQDLRRDLIHGSHNNQYQMDGLESLIKTGYKNDNGDTTPQVDSYLLDWKYDDLTGAVNGYGNFFDTLDQVVNDIDFKASAFGTISEADMCLMTSRFMATALLDGYACYTICGVTSQTNISDQALRAQARQMRRDLNGGPLYDGASAVGFIQLKSGRRIPIIVDDAIDITRPNANYSSDIYLLTRRVGSIDTLYGEYLDLRVYENRVRAHFDMFTARADAAGRFVTKGKEDNWCVQLIMGTSPEIYISAPWACARIQHVTAARTIQPITGDPYQSSYLPGGGRPLHKAFPDMDSTIFNPM